MLLFCLLWACAPRSESQLSKTSDSGTPTSNTLIKSDFVLGTLCSVSLGQGSDPSLLDAVFNRLRQIESELSTAKEGSQIDSVNTSAGIEPVKVGADALAILERDISYAEMTGGGFDPSIGPLVGLWAISSDHPRLPSESEIFQARALVGWKDIILDREKSTIYLARRDMALDLGSGTKGYAADSIVDILRRAGVKSALIDLGGNILVLGAKGDGTAWQIGLQDPSGDRGSYIGVASLKDASMVTSGVYERFFVHEGKRYHHILNPFTGYPYDNGLLSVTIISPRSFDADGMTTALFALGREKGMELARKRGILVIMIDDAHRIWLSTGVSKVFRLTSTVYSLAEQ